MSASARLSVRVPEPLKAQLRAAVNKLDGRGLKTSDSELVQALVAQGMQRSVDEVEGLLRDWRRGDAAPDTP